MPINVYTGLMGSGKSYEVVAEVIVPAIRSGRRVTTNVDGISEERIHDYLHKRYPEDDQEKYGRVLHVTNAEVFGEKFFPYYDDDKSAHTDTIVQPGDLVCIDEAWRFWGSSESKVHKNHRSFFLEHRHFTSPVTNVSCDLVLMIQDMATLDRKLKSVVAFSFRAHKKVSLGLTNTYSLTMWEGYRQTKKTQIGNWVRRYQKDVFPLYSSFKGGAQGVIVNADKRQNIFNSKKIWVMLALFIFGTITFGYNIYKFFNPAPIGKDGKPLSSSSAAPGAGHTVARQAAAVVPQSASEEWRVAGTFQARGNAWVVVVNSAGVTRLASPSEFQNHGLSQVGQLDGRTVTSWSGTPAKAVAFGEVKK